MNNSRLTRTASPARIILGMLPLLLMTSILGLAGCAHNQPKTVAPLPKPPLTEVYNQALTRIASRNQAAPASNDYRIGPGDIIEIKVYEQDKFSGTFRVGGDGTIRFSPLGLFKVADMSERELEAFLEGKLRDEYIPDPHVTVYVKEPHAREVTISGQVRSPGIYPIFQMKTLVDLIAKAGGLTEQAGKVAYVIRGDDGKGTQTTMTQPASPVTVPGTFQETPSNNIEVDLDRLLVVGEEKWNVQLRAGDRIMVPVAGWVHVTGKGLEKPGNFMLRGSSTNKLSQYIDEAGGLKFTASYKMQLVRRHLDGTEEIIPVDFHQIADDHRNDIPLQREDTIVVNQNTFKVVVYYTAEAFKAVFRISVGGYYDLFGNDRGGRYGY